MASTGKITRRTLLASGAILGGGAVFGFFATPDRYSLRSRQDGPTTWVVTWLGITPDNGIKVLVPHAEMGQGVHTSLPMMLAEEIGADWSLVSVQQAPADPVFAVGDMIKGFIADDLEVPEVFQRHLDYSFYKVAGLMHMQITGGSGSVRFTGQRGMRHAGAAAREMLIRAAAEKWGVNAEDCDSRDSHIHHLKSGETFRFGDIAEAAAALRPPPSPVLKKKESYRICGKPIPRFDVPAKVAGMQEYGIDIRLPGMKYAAIRHAPVFGGSAVSIDDSKIAGEDGIEAVIKLDSSVVVVADNYWRANQALKELPIEFADGIDADFSSTALEQVLSEKLNSGKQEIDLELGSSKLKGLSEQAVEFEYGVPFLAHATMEPMNCTAWYHDGQLDIWTGTQDALGTRAYAAEVAELDMEKVIFHPVHLGGGFGRRLPSTQNYVEEAVSIAKQLEYPVQLVWSREEDIQHDYYRPAVRSRFTSFLDGSGQPLSWNNVYTDIGVNDDIEAAFPPYAIPNQRIARVVHETPVPVSYWRSVEHSYQGFFIESFIDELAFTAGIDPLEYRTGLLKHSRRYQNVLEKAAGMIGWKQHKGEGYGFGIALKKSFGTIVAQAAEVSIDDSAKLRIHRMVAVVDAGEIINPQIARAQVESAMVYGLTALLYGRISVEKGRVQENNFPDYRMLTLADCPEIDISFIESGERIGGIGEVGLPPVAPAVCNALYAAGGARIRELPISGQDLMRLV